ncbi:hypothetical protein MED193_08263 [Roseobacter sp. MED193]|uniref:hypothetical protein n=1 Tax=Roseobacter sp. MED193 TaxID=314262 RepID=UPI000068E086|nr:hypothetical protein [Roseobacter sp. MED193]EAQ45632.1 hypothetical protein MED193_08263 [Roseobacter sp. MED193]
MTNWITATGAEETPASNLHNNDLPSAIRSEVGNGGGWESAGNGQTASNPSISYQARPNDDESGGLMATVRSHAGSPIMGRSPRGSDIIKVQGMGVSLNVAANMGLVNRNPDGSFSEKVAPATMKDPAAEAISKAPATAEAKGKTEGEPEGVSFGDAGDAAMADLLAGQNPGELFKTVDSVLHYGDVDKATIGRMASKAGIEPEAMEAQVMEVWQGAHDAATDFMVDAGIENGDAFQAFVTSNPQLRSDMMEAARNYFVHHKTEGLQTMADAYLPQMDRYETSRVRDMLTDAGYQFADKPGGGLFVMVNGTPVSWEVAVKQKIVTFSRG